MFCTRNCTSKTKAWKAAITLPCLGASGLACARDGSCIYVISPQALTTLSTADGSVLDMQRFAEGSELELQNKPRLCVTPTNTLLITEYYKERLREVTTKGQHIRCLGEGQFGGGVRGVAVHDGRDLVAVLKHGVGRVTPPVDVSSWVPSRVTVPERVFILEYSSGALSAKFATVGLWHGELHHEAEDVRFLPAGECVAVADFRRVCVFTVAGACVRTVSGFTGTLQLDVRDTGEFVVVETKQSRLWVLTSEGAPTQTLGRCRWDDSCLHCYEMYFRPADDPGGPDVMLRAPAAVAHANNHMYVLNGAVLHVFAC